MDRIDLLTLYCENLSQKFWICTDRSKFSDHSWPYLCHFWQMLAHPTSEDTLWCHLHSFPRTSVLALHCPYSIGLWKSRLYLLSEAFFQPKDGFWTFYWTTASTRSDAYPTPDYWRTPWDSFGIFLKKPSSNKHDRQGCYFVLSFWLGHSFAFAAKIKGISPETTGRAKTRPGPPDQFQSKSHLLQHEEGAPG